MHNALFWQLIDHSRQQAAALNQTHAETLTTALQEYSVEDIIGFEALFTHYFNQAYDWGLWAAAYIIEGGCSDDGFMDFRAWLIGQGESMYTKVLDNPDVLADSIEDEDDLYVLESQDIWSVAAHVYQSKMGTDGIPMTDTTTYPTEPKGKAWAEADLANLLPKLYKQFE